MEEITFSSEKDLYKRILPALRSKAKILHMKGFKGIKEKDIWDYLRLNKWIKSNGLELCELVDDILHCEDKLIIMYFHDKQLDEITNDIPHIKEPVEKIEENIEDDFVLPKLKD